MIIQSLLGLNGNTVFIGIGWWQKSLLGLDDNKESLLGLDGSKKSLLGLDGDTVFIEIGR